MSHRNYFFIVDAEVKYDVLSTGNGVNGKPRKNQIISKGSEGQNSVFKK